LFASSRRLANRCDFVISSRLLDGSCGTKIGAQPGTRRRSNARAARAFESAISPNAMPGEERALASARQKAEVEEIRSPSKARLWLIRSRDE
jgi:hypothetical protein